MKKLALALLTLSLTLNAGSLPKVRITYQSNIPQVVHLKMPDSGMCTGFVIKKGVIATAAHCVDSVKTADVEFTSGKHAQFKVVDHGIPGTSTDWGLLVGDTQNIQPLSFPATLPRLPFSTLSVGYGPQGPQMVIPQLVIGGEADPIDTKDFSIICIGEVDHGDSGGPLLGPNNTLLGIIYMLDKTGHQSYSVPYEELQKALLKNNL